MARARCTARTFCNQASGPSAGVLVSDVPPILHISPYLPQMKPTSIIACVAALSSCTQQASSFVCLPSTQARIAHSRSCVRPCRSSADASDPKDMKVSEIKAELDQLRVDYHGLFEKVSESQDYRLCFNVLETCSCLCLLTALLCIYCCCCQCRGS
jgi:hypothetical protein